MKVGNNILKRKITNGHISFEVIKSGDIHKISYDWFNLTTFNQTAIDGQVFNLYLRIKKNGEYFYTKMIGVDSPSFYSSFDNHIIYKGEFKKVKYEIIITILEDKWFYTINLSSSIIKEAEVFYGFDLMLNGFGANEAYNAQYIDHKVDETNEGYIITSRQNLGVDYLSLMGSLTKNVSFSTDGFQFFGKSFKETNKPYILSLEHLENKIYQYEFTYLALQSEKLNLETPKTVVFYNYVEPKTNDFDALKKHEEIKEVYNNLSFEPKDKLLFTNSATKININNVLAGDSLDENLINKLYPERYEEEYEDGKLLSFFTKDSSHVVLKEKELKEERTTGSIIINNGLKVVNEDIMCNTSFMNGVFLSHISYINSNFGKFLSSNREQLNVVKISGQRIMIKHKSVYYLLGMPSLFEMGFNYSKWIYKLPFDVITICVTIDKEKPYISLSLKAKSKSSYDFLVVSHLGVDEQIEDISIDEVDNGFEYNVVRDPFIKGYIPNLKYRVVFNTKNNLGSDSLFYFDKDQDNVPVITNTIKKVNSFEEVIEATEEEFLEPKFGLTEQMIREFREVFNKNINYFKVESTDKSLEKYNHLLKWYLHNALIHYASPHGLEQYSGAAWGFRDVLQGPVELFEVLGRYDLCRDVFKKSFSRQFIETLDFPQWFMFDRFSNIKAQDSHGDIIVWPLVSLGRYLKKTNDISILDEVVPYFTLNAKYSTEEDTIFNHLIKEVKKIKENAIPGTSLTKYGGGDWDDTLQPRDSNLAKKMVSGWTIPLTIEGLELLYDALKDTKYDVSFLKELSEEMKKDYFKYFYVDNVPAGFVVFNEDGNKIMLHPKDDFTGINYRLLPLTRGIISGLYSKEDAEHLYEVIKKELVFPDGAHLMNNTVKYDRGINRIFQRAEKAANFGREIGLLYVHAHIRYVEALAKLRKRHEINIALQQVSPIRQKEFVPNASVRQSNMYFSSSDAAFYNRYEAMKNFNKVKDGSINVKGGWRLYSSGPGIYIHQVITNLFGIDSYKGDLLLKPNLEDSDTSLTFMFNSKMINFKYHVSGDKLTKILLNGKEIKYETLKDKYEFESYLISDNLLKDNDVLELFFN